jgi:ribosome-associated heat shock protein Hsp15
MKRDHAATAPTPGDTKIRLDKWLWAARFYKTRSLSGEEIDKGRVRINGQAAKASREVRAGDEIEMRTADSIRTVRVLGVSGVRGSAPVAALLYQETEASAAARLAAAERRRLAPEPAQAQTQGRPTKRDRRDIDTLRNGPRARDWNARWSASLDD